MNTVALVLRGIEERDDDHRYFCWVISWEMNGKNGGLIMFNMRVNHLKHLSYFSIYWECHHPNWRTPSFFRGVAKNHQPDRILIGFVLPSIKRGLLENADLYRFIPIGHFSSLHSDWNSGLRDVLLKSASGRKSAESGGILNKRYFSDWAYQTTSKN